MDHRTCDVDASCEPNACERHGSWLGDELCVPHWGEGNQRVASQRVASPRVASLLRAFCGRLIEVSGQRGAGVSTFAAFLVAQAQEDFAEMSRVASGLSWRRAKVEEQDGCTRWILWSQDEHARTYPPDLKALGVDLARLHVLHVHGHPSETEPSWREETSKQRPDEDNPRKGSRVAAHACKRETRSSRDLRAHAALRATEIAFGSGRYGAALIDWREAEPLSPVWQKRLLYLCRRCQASIVFLTRKQAQDRSLGPMVALRLHVHPNGSQGFRVQVLKNKSATCVRSMDAVTWMEGMHSCDQVSFEAEAVSQSGAVSQSRAVSQSGATERAEAWPHSFGETPW